MYIDENIKYTNNSPCRLFLFFFQYVSYPEGGVEEDGTAAVKRSANRGGESA